ncbi:MAG: LytTR family DNA-binding domain-containing protein [Pseudomonadota bacterium]
MYERSLENAQLGPFAQRLIITGAALTALFAVIAPESSEPLTLLPRTLFWALHISLGLAAAVFAARFLVQRYVSLRDWRLVVASGLCGALIFAPIAVGLESLFPLAPDGPADSWADRFAATSTVGAVLIEAIELIPPYLTAWLLINLESISPALRAQVDANADSDTEEEPSSAAALRHAEKRNSIQERLPPAIGRDIVAISSDLHYLQVMTRAGRATILGSLAEVDTCFGDAGLRVHRSHWVLLDAVVRLRKSGNGWQLDLAGNHSVPVSRRRRTEVLQLLGDDFVRKPDAV